MVTKLKHISSTELRTYLRDVLEDVRYNGGIYVIETFGRPMAVLVGIDKAKELSLLSSQDKALVPEVKVGISTNR